MIPLKYARQLTNRSVSLATTSALGLYSLRFDPVKPGRIWLLSNWEAIFLGVNGHSQLDMQVHLLPPGAAIPPDGTAWQAAPMFKDFGGFLLSNGYQVLTESTTTEKIISSPYLGETNSNGNNVFPRSLPVPFWVPEGWVLAAFINANSVEIENGTFTFRIRYADLDVNCDC